MGGVLHERSWFVYIHPILTLSLMFTRFFLYHSTARRRVNEELAENTLSWSQIRYVFSPWHVTSQSRSFLARHHMRSRRLSSSARAETCRDATPGLGFARILGTTGGISYRPGGNIMVDTGPLCLPTTTPNLKTATTWIAQDLGHSSATRLGSPHYPNSYRMGPRWSRNHASLRASRDQTKLPCRTRRAFDGQAHSLKG